MKILRIHKAKKIDAFTLDDISNAAYILSTVNPEKLDLSKETSSAISTAMISLRGVSRNVEKLLQNIKKQREELEK